MIDILGFDACPDTELIGFCSFTCSYMQRRARWAYSGHLFVFRGRRGDLLKIIWWDSQGACLFSKRLEKGRFVWPAAKDGKVSVTAAQLSMLLEGIDWRILLLTALKAALLDILGFMACPDTELIGFWSFLCSYMQLRASWANKRKSGS